MTAKWHVLLLFLLIFQTWKRYFTLFLLYKNRFCRIPGSGCKINSLDCASQLLRTLCLNYILLLSNILLIMFGLTRYTQDHLKCNIDRPAPQIPQCTGLIQNNSQSCYNMVHFQIFFNALWDLWGGSVHFYIRRHLCIPDATLSA